MTRRKNETILNILCELPWWISVILSISTYIVLKYIVPLFKTKDMVFQGIIHAAPNIAFMLALFFIIPAPLSALNSWRKRQLLEKQKSIDTVRSLNWNTFETLVGEAYRRKGYSVTENMENGPDDGIDLHLRKNDELVLVQCKHWKAYKVDVKVVREFYGVIIANNASRGILITSGTFTRPAKDFINDKPIELIEGKELESLISEVQKSKNIKNNRVLIQREKVLSFTCPKCGSKMNLKTAKTGPTSGQRFWGCSRFPDCRGSRRYEG